MGSWTEKVSVPADPRIREHRAKDAWFSFGRDAWVRYRFGCARAAKQQTHRSHSSITPLATVIALALMTIVSTSNARAAGLTFSPKNLNFGSWPYLGAGNTSPTTPQTITITNGTAAPIQGMTVLPLQGADADDFQMVTNNCPADIFNAGSNCTVTFTFTPGNFAKRTAKLQISDSANARAALTVLSGVGAKAKKLILPSVVPFGPVQVGQSASTGILLTNDNPVTVNVTSITTTDATFTQSNGCSSLSPGANCGIFLTFTPTKTTCNPKGTMVTANLEVTSDAGSVPQTVKLTGIALPITDPLAFITNTSSNQVTAYPLLGTSNQPEAIVGSASGLVNPTGIAVSSKGNIYIANNTSGSVADNVSSISVFSACTNAIASPHATIVGPNTGLDFSQGVALDSLGNLYVTNLDDAAEDFGSVTIYGGSAHGNARTIAMIAGDDTLLNQPEGIVLDSKNNIYVANERGGPSGFGSVTVYRFRSNGNAAPFATITGSTTGLTFPMGIALDPTGNIYVANLSGGPSGVGSVTIYPPLGTSTGTLDESPIATISAGSGVDNTELDSPEGIALDSSLNIYVVNSVGGTGSGSVTIYPPLGSSTGLLNEAPTAIISGSDSTLSAPWGIAIGHFVPTKGGAAVSVPPEQQ